MAEFESRPASPSASAIVTRPGDVALLSLRLPAGRDLRGSLEELVLERGLKAAWVSSAIGSLEALRLRPAGEEKALELPGPWELLSLQGSLGGDGVHLHLAVADAAGHCRGGHLLGGNRIRTTAEIALLLPGGTVLHRRLDPATGHRELQVDPAA